MQYFKGKTGSLFIEETHSDSKFEQKRNEDLKGPVFFVVFFSLTENQILVAS